MGAGNSRKVRIIQVRSATSRRGQSPSTSTTGTYHAREEPRNVNNTTQQLTVDHQTAVKSSGPERESKEPCENEEDTELLKPDNSKTKRTEKENTEVLKFENSTKTSPEPTEDEEDTEVLKIGKGNNLRTEDLDVEELVKPKCEDSRVYSEETSLKHPPRGFNNSEDLPPNRNIVEAESNPDNINYVTSGDYDNTYDPSSSSGLHRQPSDTLTLLDVDNGNEVHQINRRGHQNVVIDPVHRYQNGVQGVTPRDRNVQTITNITNITTSTRNIEPSIKQQFQQVIKSYKEEDSVFVETEAYKRARKLLVNNHFLTLIGKPGSGKTSIARHLLISFLDDKTCEESVLVTSPDDWKKLVDVKRKQFVLIENIFGFTNLSQERLDLWGPMLDIIHRVLLPRNSQLFVVFTCRYHILMDAMKFLEDNNLFVPMNVINLTDHDLLLTIQEKREILLKHVHDLREDEIRTIVKCPLPHGYPYCCRMFATNISFRKRGPEFFEKPKEYIKEEINLLRMTDKVKFCVLVLCMLNDGHVSKTELDFSRLKKHEITRLKEVLRVVEVPAEISSFSLIEALENLTSLYLLKTDTIYSFLHPCLLETVADIMSKYVAGEVINLCSWTFIHEKVRTNKLDLNPDSFTILLEQDDYEPLAIRLSQEVLNGRIKSVVHHQACTDENFIKAWIKSATDNGKITDLCLNVDVHKRSLLYWAVWSKNMTLFKYFFMCCRPNIERQKVYDEQKSMILLAASFFRLCYIVDIILNSVVEIDYQDIIEPSYALEKYTVYGFKFGRLLSVGPSILQAAVCGGNVDIVKQLIDYKAPINVKDMGGGTPLHAAACACVPETVEHLINAGAVVNAQDINGWTPLHIIAGSGYVRDSGNSLEKMFNISKTECLKNGSFNHGHDSIPYKQTAILEIFKRHGATLHVRDYEKDTPLHVACVNGRTHVVQWLLKQGLDVNEQTGCYLTPLHLSAEKGNVDICKLLLANGAEVNASQLKFCNRPIHYATCSGSVDVVKLLVSSGANTQVRNDQNKTALDLAKEKNFHHIVKYLQVFSSNDT